MLRGEGFAWFTFLVVRGWRVGSGWFVGTNSDKVGL